MDEMVQNKVIEYWKELAGKSEINAGLVNSIADGLKEEMQLAFVGASFYEYSCLGVWKEVEVDYLKKVIKDILGSKSSRRLIAEIMEQLRLASLRFLNGQTHPQNLINVKNGLLDLNTYGLISHSPEYFYANQLPLEFNQEARSPKWIKTVNEIFEEDASRINLLQELFGYVLIPNTREEKAFFFIGTGQNGKGVVLHVLINVIGEGNYSTVSLSDLSKPFRLIEIKDKLLNITAETKIKLRLEDDIFKTVVSGEPITAEKKYQHPFQFWPYARWVIAMNHFPEIIDRTEGTWRRIIPIEFNRYFTEQERDNDLKHDLVAEELPGIFNWALDGLKRYRKQGSLYIPDSVREVAKKYRKDSNPVHLFIDGEFELIGSQESTRIRAEELYRIYTSWRSRNGLREESNKEFAETFSTTFPMIVKGRDAKGHYYSGLRRRACV